MEEQLKLLIELQEIDSFILSIAEKIESLPRRLEQFKHPLKEESESVQKAEAKSDVLNKKKKEKDMELDEIQDRINKLKARSSEIKTNKEYEAHIKEIEGFEKSKYKMEDEILSLMEDIENYSGYLKEKKMKVKKAEDEFQLQEKVLEEEKKNLHSEMEMCKSKRRDFVAGIDEENYDQYMKLLDRMGGVAIVPTQNEICLGCNTNIPPQLYNDIKKNDRIITCYYCKRLLYYKEPAPSDKESREAPPAS